MTNPELPNYVDALRQEMLDRLTQYNRYMDAAAGIDPDNRPDRYVEKPLAPAWLTARTEFITRWQALTEEGLDNGYLEHGHCYECGGELNPTIETTEHVREPNPDYDPTKLNPNAGGSPMPFLIPTWTSLTIPKGDA